MSKTEDSMNIARDRSLIHRLEGQRINASRKLLQVNCMSYPRKKCSGFSVLRGSL